MVFSLSPQDVYWFVYLELHKYIWINLNSMLQKSVSALKAHQEPHCFWGGAGALVSMSWLVGWHVISWLAELYARLRLPDFTHYLKILACLLTLHYCVPIRLHLPVKSSFTFTSLFFSAFDEWFRLTTFQKAPNTKNKNSKTVNGKIKQGMLL